MSTPYNTAALHTLGCKVNFTETSTISRRFQEKGVSIVDLDESADIYVINTCSVTENANRKCNKLVRSLKNKNPHSFIVVTGCYAQLQYRQLTKNKYIDLVVGTEQKLDIPEIVIRQLNSTCISETDKIKDFQLSYSSNDRVRSFIKIQDGCDYNCSFCTIPLARGKSRSSTINEVLGLVNQLSDEGFKEAVLSGINLGDFREENHKRDFFDLLKELHESATIPRIRISSIEPNLLTPEIIDLLSQSNKFMPHLHIPLQSGCNKVLKLMKRRYTKEFYIDQIKKIKNKIHNISIGVDVIVGFPSETDDDFNETYNLLEELEVSYLHVFPFSERENTYAYDMNDKVTQNEKNQRSRDLRRLSDILKSRFLLKNLHKEQEVLIEGVDKDFSYGLTKNHIKVQIPSNNLEINNLVRIKMVDILENSMKGELI